MHYELIAKLKDLATGFAGVTAHGNWRTTGAGNLLLFAIFEFELGI